MPETIDYKVNIDASSVADQLQQLKGQLDQAMASYTFSATTPDPTPQAYAFPTAQFTQQMNVVSQAGTEMSRDISTSMALAQDAAMSLTDTARLGYQKFTRDVQNTMLMTPAGVGTIPFSPDEKWMPSFRGMSQSRAAFEAITGYGHENGMSISPGRYRERARNAFSDNLVDWTVGAAEATGTALTLGGLVAGGLSYTAAAGTGLGYATAATAMGAAGVPLMLAEGFMATAGYDIRPAMQARSYIRDTSWRTLMGETKGAALDKMALDVVTAGRTNATLGYGVSNTDAMQMVQGFTEVGGFDNVRTADEYSKRVKMVVENSRYLQEVLQASQKEVLGFMKEGITMGLMNDTTTARQFGLTMAGMAYKAGYTPSEFHTFGMQSAEMVRGTGVLMGAGYIGGQGALAITKDMMRSGNLGPEAIAQMGGVENTAASMNRLGWNFGLSDPGFTFLLANKALGPTAAGTSPTNQLAAALGQVNSLSDYMNLKGEQPMMASKMGAPALYGGLVNQKLRVFDMLQKAEGIELNENTWAVLNEEQFSTGRAQSNLEFSYLRDSKEGKSRIIGDTIGAAEKLAAEQSRGTIGVAWDLTKNNAARFLGTRSWAQGTMDMGNAVDQTLKKFTDYFSTHEYRDRGYTNINDKVVASYLLRPLNTYTDPERLQKAQGLWEEGVSNTIDRMETAASDPKAWVTKDLYNWLDKRGGSLGTAAGATKTLLEDIQTSVGASSIMDVPAYLTAHNTPKDIDRMAKDVVSKHGITYNEAKEMVTRGIELAPYLSKDTKIQQGKAAEISASNILKISLPEIDKLWNKGSTEVFNDVYFNKTGAHPELTEYVRKNIIGIRTHAADSLPDKLMADLASGFGKNVGDLVGVTLGKGEDPLKKLMGLDITAPGFKEAFIKDQAALRQIPRAEAEERWDKFIVPYVAQLRKNETAQTATQATLLNQAFSSTDTNDKLLKSLAENTKALSNVTEGTQESLIEAYGILRDEEKLKKIMGKDYDPAKAKIVLAEFNKAISPIKSTDSSAKMDALQTNMLNNYESVQEQTRAVLSEMGADFTTLTSEQVLRAQGDLTNNYLNKIALAVGTTSGYAAMRTMDGSKADS
jgi:hypothetical protein